MGTDLAVAVSLAPVPAGAEVAEPGRRVGQQVPDDDEDGPADRALGADAADAAGEAAEPLAEEGVGAGRAERCLGAVALEVGVAVPLAGLALAGAGLAGDGGEPGQAARWPGVGNRVMSRPVSAMIALAGPGLTPALIPRAPLIASGAASIASSAAAAGRPGRVTWSRCIRISRGWWPPSAMPPRACLRRRARPGRRRRPGRPASPGRARRRRWPPGCHGPSWSRTWSAPRTAA